MIEEFPFLEAEYLVGKTLGRTLKEVREIPRAEFLGWLAIINKHGSGSINNYQLSMKGKRQKGLIPDKRPRG